MIQRDYITRAGWQQLNDELDRLWRVRRPHVVNKLADAAAEGDRSENAEYIYRKKELREIDRRIRHLRRRLEVLSIAPDTPARINRVFFGAHITGSDDTGQQWRYKIVGADETDPGAGWISLHSPVARALLGQAAGQTVIVDVPADRRELTIESIEYVDPTGNY